MATTSRDDVTSLHRIVEAMTGLSTLSSVWDAGEPQSIADDLGLAVLLSLPRSFVVVRWRGAGGLEV